MFNLRQQFYYFKQEQKRQHVLTRTLLSLLVLVALTLAPLDLVAAESEQDQAAEYLDPEQGQAEKQDSATEHSDIEQGSATEHSDLEQGPEATGPKANQVLTSEDGRITINFHPEMQKGSGPYPVLRVQGKPISQEFIDKFLELYMRDITLYPAKLITMQEELAHADEHIAQLEERQKMEDEDGAHEPYIAYLKQLQAGGLEDVEIWDANSTDTAGRFNSYLDFVHNLQAEDPEDLALIGEDGASYSLLTVEQPQDFNYFSLTYQKTSFPTNQSIYTIDPIRFALYPQGHMLSQEEAEKISPLAQADTSQYYLADDYYPSGIENGEEFSKLVDQISELPDQDFSTKITSSVPEWSREEALQKANDLVKSLGLEHLQLAYQDAAMATCFGSLPTDSESQSTGESSENQSTGESEEITCYLTPVWKFIYYPSYADHSFAYNIYGITDRPFMLDEDVSAERLPAPWNFEALELALGTDGLISLSYCSPMDVVEEISPEAQLLAEEEILSLAETMLVRKEEDAMAQNGGPQDQVELNIEYATLTPYRILDQDDPLQGTIVPVWNFYGSKSLVYQMYDGNFIFRHERNPYDSFLTLNALDGTVIDLTQGK